MNELLTEKSFVLYAARYYQNPACLDIEDFEEDMSRFKYIRRLLTQYKEGGPLRERLILNHMIVIYNVFGAYPGARMLLFKFQDVLPLIMPFMAALNKLPDRTQIGHEDLVAADIVWDQNVIKSLKEAGLYASS